MHGCRIGQGHFIQFPDVIGDEPPLKIDLDLAFLWINLSHLPDVAVVHILFVIFTV